MSKQRRTDSAPAGKATNVPGEAKGEHIRGQVPNMRNPPPPPPPKSEE